MILTNVREHIYVRNSLLDHRAIATVVDYNPKTDKAQLVGEVSIRCGYHPLGYGIYGEPQVVSNGEPNEYRVYWRTGTHCD